MAAPSTSKSNNHHSTIINPSLEKTPRQQPGPLMDADGALIEQPSGEV
jgi:hypothetical protein